MGTTVRAGVGAEPEAIASSDVVRLGAGAPARTALKKSRAIGSAAEVVVVVAAVVATEVVAALVAGSDVLVEPTDDVEVVVVVVAPGIVVVVVVVVVGAVTWTEATTLDPSITHTRPQMLPSLRVTLNATPLDGRVTKSVEPGVAVGGISTSKVPVSRWTPVPCANVPTELNPTNGGLS